MPSPASGSSRRRLAGGIASRWTTRAARMPGGGTNMGSAARSLRGRRMGQGRSGGTSRPHSGARPSSKSRKRHTLCGFDSRRSCLDLGQPWSPGDMYGAIHQITKSSICFVIFSLNLLLTMCLFQQANIYTSTCARPSESEGDRCRRIP
ncbi:hypothetical protein SEVIR_5G310850v4 [Setaria viridis]